MMAKSILHTTLECQYGLLTQLKYRCLLADELVADINADLNMYRQNDRLIELIPQILEMGERNREQFIAALKQTGQGHLSQYLDVENGPEDIDMQNMERPLTESERAKIKLQSLYLIETIDLQAGLLNFLTAYCCITEYHKASINGRLIELQKNEELLEIIKRRSLAQYLLFVRCLHETNQGHIAKVLESEGVIIAADGECDVFFEKLIVESFEKLSTDEVKLKLFSQLLGIPYVELLALTGGHSIRFFFFCRNLEALRTLCRLNDSGQLKPIVESMCSQLSSVAVNLKRLRFVNHKEPEEHLITPSKVAVGNKAVVTPGVYKTASDRILNLPESGRVTLRRPTSCSGNLKEFKLPPELLEMILTRSFLVMHTAPWAINQTIVYDKIAGVCAEWRATAKARRYFKRNVHSRLDDAWQRQPWHVQVLKSFYVQTLAHLTLPKVLAAEMFSKRKLTYSENRSILRSADEIESTKALLLVLLGKPVDVFVCFLQQLKDTKQYLLYLLLSSYDHNLKERHARTIRIHHEVLAEKLDVQSSWLLPQLLSSDVISSCERNYLGTFAEHRAAADILLHLIALKPVEVFNRFVEVLTAHKEYDFSDILHRESKYDAVEVKEITTIQPGGSVVGVAQLFKRIYIICERDSFINVYDSTSFMQLESISFNLFVCSCNLSRDVNVSPRDLASCALFRCLYVYDVGNNVIWRCRIDGRKPIDLWMSVKQIEYSWKVSVTSSGQVVLVDRVARRIDIYESNALLKFTIDLSSTADLLEPRHAFETWSGDFVVCHGWDDTYEHKVRKVNTEGKVLESYGEGKGDLSNQLHQPNHLAVDVADRIYIGDYFNNRILVLDEKLQASQILLSKESDGILGPRRLQYNEEERRLFVGDETCVRVYHVKLNANYENKNVVRPHMFNTVED